MVPAGSARIGAERATTEPPRYFPYAFTGPIEHGGALTPGKRRALIHHVASANRLGREADISRQAQSPLSFGILIVPIIPANFVF